MHFVGGTIVKSSKFEKISQRGRQTILGDFEERMVDEGKTRGESPLKD